MSVIKTVVDSETVVNCEKYVDERAHSSGLESSQETDRSNLRTARGSRGG